MSRIDTLVCTDARKTKYRFVVLTMIFLVYAINYADRTNIGVTKQLYRSCKGDFVWVEKK